MAEQSAAGRGRIFISYRREDAAYPAGWLFDRLAERFGPGQIFKDVDSIELGDDFVEVIGDAVGASDVLLALIGEKWLTVADEEGDRRLDDPLDFVRVEIEAALQRKVRVIPILVEGARMPREEQLPPSLAPLARRQALELSPARFGSDTTRLLRVLETTLAEAEAGPTPVRPPLPPAPPPREERTAVAPPARERVTHLARPLSVGLALTGAALGLVANLLPSDTPIGSLGALAPETIGVPVLVAVTAALLLAGRIGERLACGAFLGFGLLSMAGVIGMWRISVRFELGQGQAALVLFLAGVLFLAAGLLVAVSDLRAPGAWATSFRLGPPSLLAAAGAAAGVVAMTVPFAQAEGGSASVVDLPGSGFTAFALEPIVSIAAALVAAYTLGKGGAVGRLSAGLALALGAQTMLNYGSLIGDVVHDYYEVWTGGPGAACYIGLAAGALLAFAGVLGSRTAPEPDLRPVAAR